MKKLLSIVLLMAFSLFGNAFAQTISSFELRERGEADEEVGYIPKSLESLVGSAGIIVSGRFGEHLKNELFWGYADTRESLREEGYSDEEIDDFGLAMSEYELVIDDVLLGDVRADKIIYRIFERSPTGRRFTNPGVDRIFFLVENPDGTYSPRGPASVLNLRNGYYTYDSLATYPGSSSNQELDIVNDRTLIAFEVLLRKAIETEQEKRD